MLSVVIPAHNEEAVIAKCLRSLLDGSRPGELEIIVACNGCTDQTVNIAREVSEDVRVVETAEASKTVALNLGDSHARGFPRFYIDADVRVGIDAIRAVASVLCEGDVLASAPSMNVDLSGAKWSVRAFYRIWLQLPYHRHGMIGSGVYALSRSGRERFEQFPNIIADDGYVRALFSLDERATIGEHEFVVRAPRSVCDLIKIKTRSRLGRYELKRKFPELDGSAHVGWFDALWQLARQPKLWPSLFVYYFVVAATVFRAKRQFKSIAHYVWERDESTRTGGPPCA